MPTRRTFVERIRSRLDWRGALWEGPQPESRTREITSRAGVRMRAASLGVETPHVKARSEAPRLLVPQRIHGIQLRCFHGWINPEEEPDRGRGEEPERHAPEGNR